MYKYDKYTTDNGRTLVMTMQKMRKLGPYIILQSSLHTAAHLHKITRILPHEHFDQW